MQITLQENFTRSHPIAIGTATRLIVHEISIGHTTNKLRVCLMSSTAEKKIELPQNGPVVIDMEAFTHIVFLGHVYPKTLIRIRYELKEGDVFFSSRSRNDGKTEGGFGLR